MFMFILFNPLTLEMVKPLNHFMEIINEKGQISLIHFRKVQQQLNYVLYFSKLHLSSVLSDWLEISITGFAALQIILRICFNADYTLLV